MQNHRQLHACLPFQVANSKIIISNSRPNPLTLSKLKMGNHIFYNTMKRILFTLVAICTIAIGYSQSITNGSYSTTGYIKSDGTIQNSSYSTKGHIKSDGTIQNASYSTIGHIKSDGTIQNSSYSTVGYVKDDGTVQNSSYSTIGHIKDDGTVQNASYSTIGHAAGVKKEWAAVVYFFFKFD